MSLISISDWDSPISIHVRALSLSVQYTEELLSQQQFLEVFLEGTRSRSGKPSTARAGMLSIVVDALCTGSVSDVLVVPVGISYDRIIEGNYNSEQLVGSRERLVFVCWVVFTLAAELLSLSQKNKKRRDFWGCQSWSEMQEPEVFV